MGNLFGGGAKTAYLTALTAQQGATQQAAANKEAAEAGTKMSLIDQYGPNGSLVYSSLGRDDNGIERFRADQSFDPITQRAVDAEKRLDFKTNELAESQADRAAGTLGTNLDYSSGAISGRQDELGLSNLQPGAIYSRTNDIGNYVDYSESAIQNRVRGMVDPRIDDTFGRERQRLQDSLMNRGVREGSQAYADAFKQFDQRENDARQQAALTSRQQAIDELGLNRAQNLQNRGLAVSELQAADSQRLQGRQQAIQELPLGRNQTLNEIASLLGTQQISPQQFVNTPQTRVNAADYQQAAQQTIAGLQGMQQQKQASAGGLFGLIGQGINAASRIAASRIAASDIRIKRNVRRIGTLDNGLPFYAFHYIGGGDQHFGLMAQDVEKVVPEAVVEVGGIKMVDYDMAAGWRGKAEAA